MSGAVLLELDAEGLRELAAPEKLGAVKAAKLKVELKRLAVARPVAAAGHGGGGGLFVVDSQVPPPSSEKKLQKHCEQVTFEGGAEHKAHWIPSIVNANVEGANVKAHVLRFLGMYNVVDLLTFTIGMQFLLEEKKEEWSSNVFDLVIVFFAALCIVLSGVGMFASTILYNTASSVSESNFHAFCKVPATNRALMGVNDHSIWGFNSLCFCASATIMKYAFSDNDFSTNFDIARAVVLAPLPLYMIRLQFGKALSGIVLTTHYALYTGFMGDAEVVPEGETPGWAVRWSQNDIFEFLAGVIMANTKEKPMTPFDKGLGANEKNILDKYKNATTENLNAAEHDFDPLQDPLLLVAKAVANGARRKSFSGIGKTFLSPDAAGVGGNK